MREGWLLKQGGRIKTWKRRYTILSGNVLYYFNSPKVCALPISPTPTASSGLLGPSLTFTDLH